MRNYMRKEMILNEFKSNYYHLKVKPTSISQRFVLFVKTCFNCSGAQIILSCCTYLRRIWTILTLKRIHFVIVIYHFPCCCVEPMNLNIKRLLDICPWNNHGTHFQLFVFFFLINTPRINQSLWSDLSFHSSSSTSWAQVKQFLYWSCMVQSQPDRQLPQFVSGGFY